MKEGDIRPQKLFNEYLALARKDIQIFFGDKDTFVEVDCPACGAKGGQTALKKLGFSYKSCLDCESLYLSPRPTESMINNYYQKGESVKFWSTRFYRETEEARRLKIYRPRAEYIDNLFRENPGWGKDQLVDVGAGYGIFLEEISRLNLFSNALGVEPAPNMAATCKGKGLSVLESPVEMINENDILADFATSFEVFEHVYSPEKFLKSVQKILKPKGVFLFTTLTIDGFDLQVLWDESKSIYPPHHINLISKNGIKCLLNTCGFNLVEIRTPGQLDVDIVLNAAHEKKDLKLSRFVRHLIEKVDDEVRDAFQVFLQENLLSSHVMVIAQKKI
jgi:2-polyprenyl-3-methyl-5-hydroxy-6-metoxy-1,4-benzoquinol methylase